VNLGVSDKVGGFSLVEAKLLEAVEEVATVLREAAAIDIIPLPIGGDAGVGAVGGGGDGLSGGGVGGGVDES